MVGTFAYYLVSAIISYAISYYTAPDGPDIEGNKTTGGDPQNSLGSTIAALYGTAPIIGKEIWRQNNSLVEVMVETENEGGKGGPDPGTTTTYEYYFTGADLVCVGEVEAVRRIWADTTLIYDADAEVAPNNGLWIGIIEHVKGSNVLAAVNFRFYSGSDTQLPDPLIEAEHGAGNVPAYRGYCYVVWDMFPLEKYGNRKPRFKYEVVKKDTGSPQQLGPTVAITAQKGAGAGNMLYKDKRAIITNDGSAWDPFWAWGTVHYIDDYEQETTAYFNRETPVGGDITDDNGRIQYYAPLISVQMDHPGYIQTGVGGTQTSIYINEFDGAGMFLAATYITPAAISTNIWHMAVHEGVAVALREMVSPYRYYLDIDRNLYGETVAVELLDITATLGVTPVTIAYQGAAIYLLDSSLMMYEISPLDGAVLDSYQIDDIFPSAGSINLRSCAAKISGGFIWFYGSRPHTNKTPTFLTRYDISARAIDRIFTTNIPEMVGNVQEISWAVELGVLHVCQPAQSTVLTDYELTRWNLEPIPRLSATLSDVVGDIWTQNHRLSPGDMDLSELTDTVDGYVTTTGDLRKHTEPLQQAYRFDVVERDYQLVAVKRGQSSMVEIPLDDLAAHAADTAKPVSLAVEIGYDKDLPQQCEVTHLSYEREYDHSVQTAKRLATPADNILKITWPLVLSDQQAADAAQVNLFSAWTERHAVAFKLPRKYMYLEPTDVVTIEAGEQGRYEVRILEIDNGTDGVISVKAITQNHTTYTPNTTPQDSGTGGSSVIGLDGDTITAMIDAPLMSELANSPGWICATTGPTQGWPGGLNHRSLDGGQSYTSLNAFSKTNRCTMGQALNVLESTPPEIWYRGPALQYRMIWGDLFSVTDEQLQAGLNTFAWGVDGRWEIIQAKTATLVDDRNIELTDIRRGQYGTVRHMDSHQAGDLVVKLDTLAIQWVQQTASDINASRLIKSVTKGASLGSVEAVPFTNRGENLKPQPPVYLRAHRPATDWLISFVPQSRYGFDGWWRGLPVPVGETTERYRIQILNAGAPVREWVQSEKTVTYTEAEQVADFGSVQDSITFDVVQWSDVMGYGYSAELTT